MNKNPLRIGVIGAGDVAGWHADGLSAEPGVKILAVAEQDPQRLEAFEKKYRVERAMSDWRELLKIDEIDLVLILAPHHLHNTMVLAALRARKHVICEKPMARTVAECDSMLVEAGASSRSLYISHSLRTGFFFQTARSLIAAGRIGRPILGSFRWLADEIVRLNDPRHWKGTDVAGGGVLLDGGCRVADLANGFFGPVRKVAAVSKRLMAGLPGRGEDQACFIAEYDSGASCSFSLSFTAGSAFRKERAGAGLLVDIFGTEGHIEGGYLVRDGSIHHYCLEHHPGSEEVYFEGPPGGEKVIDVDFVRSLLDGTPPPLTALDARNAVAVVEAAYRSVRTGRVEEVDWRT
jgi:predicted dehydrogenase